MDLKKELLKEHSKEQANKIAFWAINSNDNLEKLIAVFLSDNYRVTQRAAWPLGIIGEKYFALIKPYLGVLIKNLTKENLHDAVKRNTVRFLQDVEIPEKYMGTLTDVCMGYLANPKEAVAIKAFSMSVLLNITKKHPDLKNELKLLIEDQLDDGTAGIKNRGAKVLKALDKIN